MQPLRPMQWRKLNVTVAELMAEAEVDPTSDALQAAREHLLKELDVYRWVRQLDALPRAANARRGRGGGWGVVGEGGGGVAALCACMCVWFAGGGHAGAC